MFRKLLMWKKCKWREMSVSGNVFVQFQPHAVAPGLEPRRLWLFTSLPLSSLQAYFRQGVALQYLGRHADALAAFASGLAQDPKSLQLLVGMVEAAMKSPLRGKKFMSGLGQCNDSAAPAWNIMTADELVGLGWYTPDSIQSRCLGAGSMYIQK